MIRLIYYTFLIPLISACVGGAKMSNIGLIFYTDFVNPQKTYDSLVNDFMLTGLADSIKIIGRPVTVSCLDIRIDTPVVKEYGISLEKLKDKVESINKLKTLDELSEQYVISESGQKIPFGAFSKIYVKPGYYKPGIFIPEPEVYYFNNRRVVKMELYCKRKNEKELIELIKNRIPDHSDKYVNPEWQIVKQNIRPQDKK